MPTKALIRIKGAFGCIVEPELPPELQQELRSTLFWSDPEDLANIRYFYWDTDQRFYQGVLPQVLQILRAAGYAPTIQRIRPSPHPDCLGWPDYEAAWPYHPHPPRQFQQQAVQVMQEKKSGVVVAAARSGKSTMIAMALCQLKAPALVISYKRKDEQQIRSECERFGLPVGDLKRLDQPLISATIQGVIAALKGRSAARFREWLAECEILFTDECHHFATDNALWLLHELPELRHLFGCTASYVRDDAREEILKAIFGEPLLELSEKEAQHLQIKVPVSIHVLQVPEKDYGKTSNQRHHQRSRHTFGEPVPEPSNPRKDYHMVYQDYVVHGSTGRNDLIVAAVRWCQAHNLTCVISVKQIAHVLILKKALPEAELLIGDGSKLQSREEHDEIFRQLEQREIGVVISTLFDEAVNVPTLDCMILAAGGASKRLMIQRNRSTTACDVLLTTGRYVKQRGHLIYLEDRADFLRSQSRGWVKYLRGLAKLHPLNSFRYVTDETLRQETKEAARA